MKVTQIISEMTSGSVATVAKPLGEIQKRPDVKGLKPVDKAMSGKSKKKGPYANSLLEGKVKELQMDLSSGRDGLNDAEFKKKYGKSKEEMRKSLQDKPKSDKPVQEAKLDEDDLILIPGQGGKRKTGFVPHGQSRVDHEVEMARSDVLATIKNAKAIYELLRDRSEDEGLEGWVQEKLIKANDYLNSVKEYYDEKNIHQEMSGGVIAAGGVGEGKFTVNARTGAKLDPRTGVELPPKEKPLTMKDMFRQPKSTAPKLTLDDVWRKVEDVVGQIFPDGDPIDYLAPWLEKHGIRDFKIGEILDRAAKKNGYKDLYDYYDSMKDQYDRDNVAEAGHQSPHAKLAQLKAKYDAALKSPNPNPTTLRKIRDEIIKLKFDLGINEGAKVDRMVKHIAKSERELGKSKDEAENIAWATANKRGYLDNKNKKKAK